MILNTVNFSQLPISSDFIARIRLDDYDKKPDWLDEKKRPAFIKQNKLAFLRPYQIQAVHAMFLNILTASNSA